PPPLRPTPPSPPPPPSLRPLRAPPPFPPPVPPSPFGRHGPHPPSPLPSLPVLTPLSRSPFASSPPVPLSPSLRSGQALRERGDPCHSSPLGDYNCLDYARHPCGDSPVSARCGRPGVQLRLLPPLRDGVRPGACGDDCVPGV